MRNIVLTGLSGCGKTTLAKRLCDLTGLSFFDTDEEIERMEGKTISQIFEQKGEPYFRDLEHEAAKAAAKLCDTVISTGGGMVLNPKNMAALRQTGRVVFINRPPEQIAKDLKTGHRPLVKGNPERIFELYRERIDLYRKYAFAVIVNDLTEEAAFARLLDLVRTFRDSRKFAVIGHPVSHSLSPFIHNGVFAELRENCDYEAVEVKPGELKDWVDRVKREDIGGFNITMPHKVEIIPHLDEIDEEAKLHNSVNTVVNRDGKLKGYSTDAQGLAWALYGAGRELKDSEVLILGAGGVTNTVALKAAADGAKKITILARTVEKARVITGKIRRFSENTEVSFGEMTDENMARCAGSADILINATPLGMTGNAENFKNFDFLNALPGEAIVFDLIYSPAETKLLHAAKARSLTIQNGLSMLIYQALLSDQLYLNQKIDIESMKKIIDEGLEGRQRI